jgi:hypothetical protein
LAGATTSAADAAGSISDSASATGCAATGGAASAETVVIGVGISSAVGISARRSDASTIHVGKSGSAGRPADSSTAITGAA